MPWYIALIVTVLVIVASAFFVVIEFSLLSARRHRLEEQAETSRTARAGLRSLNELTIMLAAAQLGITAATFALGAITEPWVHHWLLDVFGSFGMSEMVSNVVAFALALFLVTFLHLVVGEMAPKSWAIAHPETALQLIAIPARALVTVLRPLLTWINRTANRLVQAAGEEPVERAAARGYNPEMLQQLVVHSVDTGTLDAHSARDIQGLINLQTMTISQALEQFGNPVDPLPADATIADVHARARKRGYLRVLMDTPDRELPSLVHVRDTVLVDPSSPAIDLAEPPLVVDTKSTVSVLLDAMRGQGEQLAIVVDDAGEVVGVLTWDDIMNRLWPEIQAATG